MPTTPSSSAGGWAENVKSNYGFYQRLKLLCKNPMGLNSMGFDFECILYACPKNQDAGQRTVTVRLPHCRAA